MEGKKKLYMQETRAEVVQIVLVHILYETVRLHYLKKATLLFLGNHVVSPASALKLDTSQRGFAVMTET